MKGGKKKGKLARFAPSALAAALWVWAGQREESAISARVPARSLRTRAAFSLVEAGFVLLIAVAAMVAGARYYYQYLDAQVSQATADHMEGVAQAVAKYMEDNYGAILGLVGANGGIYRLPVADLQPAYLSPDFVNKNPFGQEYVIVIRQPVASINKLDAMIYTQGGAEVENSQGLRISQLLGSGGGFMTVPQDGASSRLKTTYDAWDTDISTWTTDGIDPGRLVYALFFNETGALNADYLYRNAIPGRPELNRMNTAIDMNGNDVNNAGTVSATAVSVSGQTSTQTLVVSGQASAQSMSVAGESAAGTFQPTSTNAVGYACPSVGAISKDASGRALSCIGGLWGYTGTQYATEMASCTYVDSWWGTTSTISSGYTVELAGNAGSFCQYGGFAYTTYSCIGGTMVPGNLRYECGPGPTCCFPAGSLVLMADGSLKPIERIMAGDVVMGSMGRPSVVINNLNPVLGPNRRLLAFDDGSHVWSEEHGMWVRDCATGREWAWSANRDMWLAEMREEIGDGKKYATGLKDIESIWGKPANEIEFASVDGFVRRNIIELFGAPPDTQLYSPSVADGQNIIVNGYAVGAVWDERQVDYSAVRWESCAARIREALAPARAAGRVPVDVLSASRQAMAVVLARLETALA